MLGFFFSSLAGFFFGLTILFSAALFFFGSGQTLLLFAAARFFSSGQTRFFCFTQKLFLQFLRDKVCSASLMRGDCAQLGSCGWRWFRQARACCRYS